MHGHHDATGHPRAQEAHGKVGRRRAQDRHPLALEVIAAVPLTKAFGGGRCLAQQLVVSERSGEVMGGSCEGGACCRQEYRCDGCGGTCWRGSEWSVMQARMIKMAATLKAATEAVVVSGGAECGLKGTAFGLEV